jgi:hypothetical protein
LASVGGPEALENIFPSVFGGDPPAPFGHFLSSVFIKGCQDML